MKKVRLTESEIKSDIIGLERQLKKLTEGKKRSNELDDIFFVLEDNKFDVISKRDEIIILGNIEDVIDTLDDHFDFKAIDGKMNQKKREFNYQLTFKRDTKVIQKKKKKNRVSLLLK